MLKRLFALLLAIVGLGTAWAADPDYSTNYGSDAKSTHASRYTKSVKLTAEGMATQRIGDLQTAAKQTIYWDMTSGTSRFTCMTGQTITPAFGYVGQWMYGHVYLDEGRDGFTRADDLKATAAYKTSATSDTNPLVATSFTAPATPGTYRMRYVIDWAASGAEDPKGSTGLQGNGGIIVDVLLDVKAGIEFGCNIPGMPFKILADGTELDGSTYTYDNPPASPVTFSVKENFDTDLLAFDGFYDGDTRVGTTYTLAAGSTTSKRLTARFSWTFASETYADAMWVTIRNNGFSSNNYAAIFDDSGTTRIKPLAYSADNADSYKWCFVAADGGFNIYNKGVGGASAVTLDGAAADGRTISFQAPDKDNEERQLWTLAYDGASVGIVPASNTGLGWNPYGGDANPLKLFNVTGVKSRWIIGLTGLSSYLDRDGAKIVDGARYTLISALDKYFNIQQKYKAMYVNSSDGKLYWKDYAPSDEAFYFKAHVDESGALRFETMGKAGNYIVNATAAVSATGNTVAVNRFTPRGDANIVVGGHTLHTNQHSEGSGNASNIVSWTGGTNTPSAWYIQRADNKLLEVERYAKEIADRKAAVEEAARQAARTALGDALAAAVVGTECGCVSQAAFDAAKAVYDNESAAKTEYQSALTTLLAAVIPPAIGTTWRFVSYKTAAEKGWSGTTDRVLLVGSGNAMRWGERQSSLYQLWEVVAHNPDAPGQIALRNMGSRTYMNAKTASSSFTTTTADEVYLTFESAGAQGFCRLRSQTTVSGSTSLHPFGHNSGAGTSGNVIVWDGEYNTWRMDAVSEEEISALSFDEDARQASRAALLARINEVSLQTTSHGAIAYYTDLAAAISAANIVYADETRLKAEYDNALTALNTAVAAATPVAPVSGAKYMIMTEDGTKAFISTGALATADDTQASHLWDIAKSGDNYVVTNSGKSFTLTLTLVGDDRYTITGAAALAGAGNFYIRRTDLKTDYNVLADGAIVRITNVGTTQILANNASWMTQTTMAATADNTDWNQLWEVAKLPGGDRYTFRNKETRRYFGQTLVVGSVVGTVTTPEPWYVTKSGDNFVLNTTVGIATQYVAGVQDNAAKIVAADGGNTTWTITTQTPEVVPETPLAIIRLKNKGATGSPYMRAVGTSASHEKTIPTDDAQSGQWVLMEHTATIDGEEVTLYGVRNVKSGLYIQDVTANDQKVVAGINPVWFHRVVATEGANTYYSFKSSTNVRYLNASGANTSIIGWQGDDNNSKWMVEQTGLTTTETALQDAADAYEGFGAPESGKVYRVYNIYNNTYLDESYSSMGLRHESKSDTKYTQLWQLRFDDASGLWSLQNVYTDHYVMNQPVWDGKVKMSADAAGAGSFAIVRNKSIPGVRYYDMIDSRGGNALHGQGGGDVVIWSAGNGSLSASEWRFSEVTITQAEIDAIKAKWRMNNEMVEHVAEYQAVLDQIFDDKACTTIKAGLSDADFNGLVAQLPDLLADMCTKIKNNSWPLSANGRNWEKAFRIADHPAVSHYGYNQYMSGVVGIDYSFSMLNDPLGIKCANNDMVAVMVDSDVPSGAELRLDLHVGYGMSAMASTVLHRGLNIIPMTADANLFIRYMLKSSEDKPENYLSAYPDVKIHVEGGEVFGMLNRTRNFVVETDGAPVTYDMRNMAADKDTRLQTRRAEANRLWADLRADGLLVNGEMTQVRSECIMFNFRSNEFLAACPEKLGEVTDMWDWVIKSQHFVMGLRDDWTLPGKYGDVIDDYIPNLSKRFNNCFMASERSGGYMNACGYGAQYTEGTPSSILSYSNMKAGGSQWGPAHEHGHDHQKLINMVGMTEVSNNLLSNVSNYMFGAIVSRGASLPDMKNNYAAGKQWFDTNIWMACQMYYKLFLYYHAAGNDPTFYPRLFQKLRDGARLNHSQGVAIPADQDYLRFALYCSQVAGEDLSEFFEAYGFFREISPEVSPAEGIGWVEKGGHLCRTIGDYGNYYVYTTPEMIADMKAQIQACGVRNSAILFMDDRIVREASTSPFADPGAMKGDRGDGGKVGQFGDMGQYSDCAPGSPLKPVGRILYDEDGNLVYFTPTSIEDIASRFPEAIEVRVMSDGTVEEVASASNPLRFRQTTYLYDGDGEIVERTSDVGGRIKPDIKLNDMVRVTSLDASAYPVATYPHKDVPNVALDNGGTLTMANFVLADKRNFALPMCADHEIGVGSIYYARTNVAGWNSVCMPFAISNDDFDASLGAQIYTLRSNNDTEISLVAVDGVEAGEPCFVKCDPNLSATDAWVVDRTGAETVTDEVKPKLGSKDSQVQVNGSFTTKTIGAGKFKMNSNGTKFGITKASGSVTACRSYIEPLPDSEVRAQQFTIRIVEDTTTGIPTVERTMEAGRYYDLNGCEIARPAKGKPYILNGKVMVAE